MASTTREGYIGTHILSGMFASDNGILLIAFYCILLGSTYCES